VRSVVVTGASTGIGRALVAALVPAGFHVWATVRRRDDAESLLSQHGDAVSPVMADLTDEACVRAAGERVRAAGPLFALVNNAGARARYRHQMDVALANARRSEQRALPADRAVAVVLRSLTDRDPRPRRVVGRDAQVAAALVRLLPHRALYRLTAARPPRDDPPAGARGSTDSRRRHHSAVVTACSATGVWPVTRVADRRAAAAATSPRG
jgi:NAD(P)-dependent dehydrogenase (short-subunit alcohol dehydrogenase family)